ncbi:MAG: acylphosphatase [Bdellovibrionota bacterium]
MTRRHYLVSGRVQGVGFRAFTERKGAALGLEGRVRNLRDGRVEAIAIGSAEKIREFEILIAKGPMLAKVTDVAITEIDEASELLANVESFERDSDGEAPWKP